MTQPSNTDSTLYQIASSAVVCINFEITMCTVDIVFDFTRQPNSQNGPFLPVRCKHLPVRQKSYLQAKYLSAVPDRYFRIPVRQKFLPAAKYLSAKNSYLQAKCTKILSAGLILVMFVR